MPWLLRDGEVLAAVEVADSFGARLRGLLGRDGVDGALLLRRARSVHTFGMRFPVDVAFCRERGEEVEVVATVADLGRHRLTRPRLRATCVIEAEAGAFDRWRLAPGDLLEIKG